MASPAAALAFATALEHALGDDTLLTVGTPPQTALPDVFESTPTRVVTMEFATAEGDAGTVALVATAPLAEALERAASDELLLTSATPALLAAVTAIVGTEPAHGELRAELGDLARLEDEAESGTHDWVVAPILDGTDLVALFVVHAGASAAADADTGAPLAPAHAGSPVERTAAVDPGNAFVLADVEMGVTAELGRTRMTIRELLSVTPGAVIDLDRAAGAPVDVLVNGTLIARGEVVVIDEEFGIRISEIIPSGSAH